MVVAKIEHQNSTQKKSTIAGIWLNAFVKNTLCGDCDEPVDMERHLISKGQKIFSGEIREQPLFLFFVTHM